MSFYCSRLYLIIMRSIVSTYNYNSIALHTNKKLMPSAGAISILNVKRLIP